jgi:hypothetical protein
MASYLHRVNSFKIPQRIKPRYEHRFLLEFAGRHIGQGVENSMKRDNLQDITQNGDPHRTLSYHFL